VTESAADAAAAVSSAPACAGQPSAGRCLSPPSTPPPAASSETVSACASSILSPAAAGRTSTRSAAHSEHPFFRWPLRAPATDASAQHFRRHYLQSSPMCICTLFPVYSSKVDLQLPSNPSARRFLQSLPHLCLCCIRMLFDFRPLTVLRRHRSRPLQRESEAYYSNGDLQWTVTA
jgi:hypothetical protein